MNTVSAPPRKSAAGIRIAKPPQPMDLMSRLARLVQDTGTNRNDQAIAVITALLSEGVTTRSRIIETMIRLGFSNGHAAVMLAKNAGRNPDASPWCVDADGRYLLHS